MKQYETYYHVSPEASITKFQGRYSPKFKTKGLFVSPKFSSIADSWASYVSGKKHPRSEKNQSNDWYKNVTVYKLQIPKSVIKICQDLYSQRYREARARVKDPMSIVGAWGWDLELFIPSEYLNSVQIIGHQTFDKVRDLDKLSRPHFEKNKDCSISKYAEKALPNYAAKKYIEIDNLLNSSLNLEELKFVQSSFNSKKSLNKLVDFFVDKSQYGYSWSPDPKRILTKNEKQLIDSIYKESINRINKLKEIAKNIYPKTILTNHKVGLSNKINFCSNYDVLRKTTIQSNSENLLVSVKDCNSKDCFRCTNCEKLIYVK